MLKLNVLFLEKHLEPVTEGLGRLGLLHLVNAASQSRDRLLQDVDRTEDIRVLEELAFRCRGLVHDLQVSLDGPAQVAPPQSRAAISTTLTGIEKELRAEEERLSALLSENSALHKELDTLGAYLLQRTPLAELQRLSHLYVATGRIHPRALPDLRAAVTPSGVLLSRPAPETGAEFHQVMLLTSRKARWAAESALTKAGFQKAEPPQAHAATVAEERQNLSGEAERFQARMQEAQARMDSLRQRHGELLLAILRKLRGSITIARAQQHFGKAAELYCLAGWIPSGMRQPVEQLIETATAGTGVIEILAPWEDERVRRGEDVVPVQFSPSRMLSPFQKLIAIYGMPRYDEVEPSMFVAVSFVFMFGMMFGDVGQGLVLALFGGWLACTRNPRLAGLRDGGTILSLCGLSATVFGFLYGSIFGYEQLLPRLWLHPLHEVMRLLKVAMIVGVVCISAAIIVNIVNKWRNRRYFEGIFDKFGVIGILFYWGSIGVGLKAVAARELSAREIVLFVILPLVILFLREPLHNLLTHKRRILPHHPLDYVLESSIETMETVTAFLGGTVSFVRVGAFALSHTALCLAVYAVADVLRAVPGSGLWMALVVILGNLMIIVMEGMVVMIQSVRLQYYELFSKFLAGTGVQYAPFQLGGGPEPESDQHRKEVDAA